MTVTVKFIICDTGASTFMENRGNLMPPKGKVLPIIALMFALAPILWWLRNIPFLGSAFATLFIISYFGVIFTVIGLVLGIISLSILFSKRNIGIDLKGLIFSILAIFSPFVWGLILYFGYFDYIIMSYK